MELGEDMGSYEWETALKHLVKVFVKKRPGRAREAYLGRDLVFWIDALSWKECGYREEWKDWLDQLRSVNLSGEMKHARPFVSHPQVVTVFLALCLVHEGNVTEEKTTFSLKSFVFYAET
ncbi:hypothetical protein CC1G_14500 [Coprinopsis cinerea okayama7|uniref:Uncharacterized protein n=1 Tax=Coprinopsis cinerea (strain Okayama-7 / 130 / ATCC MYA-4618 / FGSC 9003) TaxID=240176 RepID=D6RLW0_COPC7|nr:hypothetical protein CC1G_14500 [Coprinopsis cinerea okayama7\|eukprot:XP_002911502.1 hypothetical protein CC1G_14500 [Coprinopsis cinerea okayama7\